MRQGLDRAHGVVIGKAQRLPPPERERFVGQQCGDDECMAVANVP
jgi:hypothetical protein